MWTYLHFFFFFERCRSDHFLQNMSSDIIKNQSNKDNFNKIVFNFIGNIKYLHRWLTEETTLNVFFFMMNRNDNEVWKVAIKMAMFVTGVTKRNEKLVRWRFVSMIWEPQATNCLTSSMTSTAYHRINFTTSRIKSFFFFSFSFFVDGYCK